MALHLDIGAESTFGAALHHLSISTCPTKAQFDFKGHLTSDICAVYSSITAIEAELAERWTMTDLFSNILVCRSQ